MNELHHIFVYGTLKKGQCREKCWPITPQSIVTAWTVGDLFDLGPYPALLPGGCRVGGQIWSFGRDDILIVTEMLDRIEVTNQNGVPNEYDRVEVVVFTLQGVTLQAETYQYSNPERLRKTAKLLPASNEYQKQRYVVWPEGSEWPDL